MNFDISDLRKAWLDSSSAMRCRRTSEDGGGWVGVGEGEGDGEFCDGETIMAILCPAIDEDDKLRCARLQC